MSVRVHVDQAAIARIGSSPAMQALAVQVAEQVASNVRGLGIRVDHIPGDIALPVEVEVESVNGHAGAQVTLAHPAGLAVQAKHGALTKGAAAVGLEVRG